MFTCVNDYADLSGELSLWHQAFRARLVLPPQRNPFRAVTVAHAPGEESTTWYCANSFFYAVQGYEGDMEAIRDGHEPVKVSAWFSVRLGLRDRRGCRCRDSLEQRQARASTWSKTPTHG